MGRKTDSGRSGKRRWIDAAAKARFLAALRLGAPIALAAEAAGFSVKGFFGVRRREPAFKLGRRPSGAASSAFTRSAGPRPSTHCNQ